MRFFSLFPAYAGVILFGKESAGGMAPFPRIRGGDPAMGETGAEGSAFSPHTRG